MVLNGLVDGVEHGHPVDVASEAAGGDAAHDLGPLAVVQAFPRQVDGLSAGDALDDEGGVSVDEDAHEALPWIRSTARLAASLSDTDRSA
jgi:hypothetical protein